MCSGSEFLDLREKNSDWREKIVIVSGEGVLRFQDGHIHKEMTLVGTVLTCEPPVEKRAPGFSLKCGCTFILLKELDVSREQLLHYSFMCQEKYTPAFLVFFPALLFPIISMWTFQFPVLFLKLLLFSLTNVPIFITVNSAF